MTSPEGPEMPKEESIGWYWRILGVLMLVGMFVFLGLLAKGGHTFTMIDVGLIGACIFAALVIVRPEWMDKHFKTIIDALPFTKFTKSE